MDIRELEKLANAGAELPDNLNYADTLYFLMLRSACETMRKMNMDSKQALREKQKIEAVVKRYKSDWDLAQYNAKIMIQTTGSKAQYRKAYKAGDTQGMLEAAGKIVEVLDNIELSR